MKELDAALEAAEAADKVLKSYYRKRMQVKFKRDGSPFTIADVESENAIELVLKKAFPEYGFLSEETGAKGSQDERWIVDPLDGTRSFIRGLPFFGPLIALEKDGRLELGVMTLPVLGETVHAVRGKGSFWNGKKAKVSKTGCLRDAFILIELKRSTEEGFGRRLLELAERSCYVRGYSDVYAYFLVATGQVDAFVEGYPCGWDVAAPRVIVEEAGGMVARLRGKKRGLAVAANARLFAEAKKVLEGKT